MTKDVLLCIQGLQFEEEAQNDEELDKIETICAGEYYYRNNAHYILYEELVEGMEEPIKNMIIFSDQAWWSQRTDDFYPG